MKKFIFTLIFTAPLAWGSGKVKEMDEFDHLMKKKLITTVKDNEIEKKLASSSEFGKCITSSKFDPNESESEKLKKANAAEECFKKELANKKDPEALKKLSDSLGLQSYGLVQSKDNAAITEYLTNKLYKSLTGIDREDQKTKKMLKFENRKMIDQEVFAQLYVNHLAKSVMFEISRYCIENFRLINPPPNPSTFGTYWEGYFGGTIPPVGSVTDVGDGSFGSDQLTGTKEEVYNKMFKNVAGAVNADKMGDFFMYCAQMITPLCDEFRKNPTAATKDSSGKSVKVRGANSCLAQERLKEGRTVFSKAQKVKEQFEKDFVGGEEIAGDVNPTFYRSEGQNTLDRIASVTSHDILEGGKGQKSKNSNLEQECAANPEKSECADYIEVSDEKDKALHNADLELRLKKQIEVARIRELKNSDAKSLKQYLEDNGYLDLLKKLDDGTLSDAQIEAEIEKAFEAKRVATLDDIKEKIGKRQMSEKDLNAEGKGKVLSENIKEAETERARMAQVVLFNNIITSYIDASNTTTKKKTRYGTSWKVEQKDLEGAGVDESLFAGLKQSFSGDGHSASGIESIEFLDAILANDPNYNKKKN